MKVGQHPEIQQQATQQAGSVTSARQQNQPPAHTPQNTNSATSNAAAGARSAGVAVTVSTLARSMEKPISSSTAEVDTAKVATVKKAIADGTYVVNHGAIADKLLSNAQEMLTRTSN